VFSLSGRKNTQKAEQTKIFASEVFQMFSTTYVYIEKNQKSDEQLIIGIVLYIGRFYINLPS